MAADLEVTVESNPDGLGPGQLAALARRSGSTRVSFGMQSARRAVLALLDRTHDPERALGRRRPRPAPPGFDHVSLDLIYGTPGETARGLGGDRATRRSTPTSTTSARTRWRSSRAPSWPPGCARASCPRPSTTRRPTATWSPTSCSRDAGFDWYELSNWARGPTARCRHNLLYWRNHHWWGVGPGAHSHVAGRRWWNHDRLGAVGRRAGRRRAHPRPATRCPTPASGARDGHARHPPGRGPAARRDRGPPAPCRRPGRRRAGHRRAATAWCSPLRGRLLADLVVRRLAVDAATPGPARADRSEVGGRPARRRRAGPARRGRRRPRRPRTRCGWPRSRSSRC